MGPLGIPESLLMWTRGPDLESPRRGEGRGGRQGAALGLQRPEPGERGLGNCEARARRRGPQLLLLFIIIIIIIIIITIIIVCFDYAIRFARRAARDLSASRLSVSQGEPLV